MMRIRSRRAVGLTLGLILLMSLSSCYQSAGGRLEPTPRNIEVTTAGFPPTFTQEGTPVADVPTSETITELPSPAVTTQPTRTPQPRATTSVPTDGQGGMAVVTNTPRQVATFPPTFTRVAQQVVPTNTSAPQRPTNTTAPPTDTSVPPTPIPTTGPSATFTQFAPSQGGVPVATWTVPPSFTPQIVGPIPTFTPQVVAQVPSFTPTQVATQALATPTPQSVGQAPTVNPVQLTATALIFGVTATAAALQGTILAPPGGPTPIPGQITPAPTLVVTLAPGITPTPVGQCNSYLIAPGDTLSRIALTYDVTVQQIAQMNNIVNPDLIRAGDTLRIPCPTPVVATPTLASGQGGFNPTPVTGGGPFTYVVEPGDNLYRLSLRFGVTLYDLMVANNMTPATINTIYAGQTLIIPASTVVQPTPVTGITPGVTPLVTPGLTPMPTQGLSAG